MPDACPLCVQVLLLLQTDQPARVRLPAGACTGPTPDGDGTSRCHLERSVAAVILAAVCKPADMPCAVATAATLLTLNTQTQPGGLTHVSTTPDAQPALCAAVTMLPAFLLLFLFR